MWPDEGWLRPEQLALRSPESTEAEESPVRGEEAGGVGWRLEARDGSLQGRVWSRQGQTTLALGSQLPLPAGPTQRLGAERWPAGARDVRQARPQQAWGRRLFSLTELPKEDKG